MTNPQLPFLTFVRGRFIRDANVAFRKDDSGNRIVMGRLRTIENFKDRHGDDRQRETHVELAIYAPKVADEIASLAPKEGQMVEAWGRLSWEVQEYQDNNGEVKSSRFFKLSVDDHPEHKAALV